MKILFLIPARKGSKGLPNKNIKLLCGKPLIQYTIDFVLSIKSDFDEVCITTNDLRVIDIAQANGINIPFVRPESLSDDNASSNDVIRHALNYYEDLNIKFDAVLYLQPTSPFRNTDDFNSLLSEYSSELDMVATVKLSKDNPYFTLFEEDEFGYLRKSKESDFQRRQDCPDVYVLNGSMYLINPQSIKQTKISDFKKVKKK